MCKKKVYKLKTWLSVKSSQFLSDQADILGTKPAHEINIFKKFPKDWRKIVDFLLISNFHATTFFS